MANAKLKGTGDIPLKFAKTISEIVNTEWDDGNGSFLEKVSPVTKDLLRYWFQTSFCDTRKINFHKGQKQAILNTIYMHEVLKTKNVMDMYLSTEPELLQKMDLLSLKQDKYNHPKYAIKMATGTGKTWVLNALLMWQYLNAKHEASPSGLFSKNFLLVAPGLIVYERLLDAYLGKEQEDGTRNFDESDFKMFEELLIPSAYKDELFGFIQSNVVKKDEIGKKVTGNGLIAITNWHLLAGEEEDQELDSPFDDPSRIIKDIIPITPGKSAGHSLETLDNQYLRGKEIEYLVNLPDMVVFNDEAHHIHDIKAGGEVTEVEWQKSLLAIAKPKNGQFIQIDFSATPYDVQGSGQKRTKHHFPHIIVDFDLKTAIKEGLVKTIALDKRKEIASLPLDFNAIRDGKKVIDLSEGQKIMLRAGLQKLRMLEKEFVEFTADKDGISNKHPKMLVLCEDTVVAPFVHDFMIITEGLSDEEVMEVHSNKKGEVTDKEWSELKQKLFSIDKHKNPKVIISVLMLREGFDVNNICVIVPLRATTSNILLEQTIGRGLRLMWREPIFEEVKAENRLLLLQKKQEPTNYVDLLSIIEHPAFDEFYNDLIKEGLIGETETDAGTGKILGDIIKVGLKQGYEEFDFYFPIIIHDQEETLVRTQLSIENLEQYPVVLEDLMKLVPKDSDVFYSEEITVKTRFGEYSVTGDLFTAKSYNEFISKLTRNVSNLFVDTGKRKRRSFPMMQINNAEIARLTDEYIRHKLFGQEFDPMEGNNWRILFLSESRIITHMVQNISREVYNLQNNTDVTDATIIKRYFSEIGDLKMRENFSLEVSKVIYEKLPYPSNKGEFEKRFMEFIDSDSKVKAFIKINENYHDFAHITYIREDGMLAHYYPDFVVRIADKIYIVETKAQKDVNNPSVKQKRVATVNWVDKVNELKPEDRMECTWNYILLGENTFDMLRNQGGSTEDILEYTKMSKAKIEGKLDGFVDI
ncbi:MAG: DEAD/DEAH box helicase family protein [Methanosarcinaceae archaeon]|nr:DEAD/DEAH box helicase family protein [Methanosarcinaceae archaeon]